MPCCAARFSPGAEDKGWLRKRKFPEPAESSRIPPIPGVRMPFFVRHPLRQNTRQTLFTRDFVLLFLLALCHNCYLAIHYCFEQWLSRMHVTPGWGGLLLGAFFGMVLVTRPAATVLLLKASKLLPLMVSLCISSAALFVYQFMPADSAWFVWMVLAVRLIQGFALAIFGSCATTLLVGCIPPGQSAQGFALFSLTMLIPYAVIPTAGEFLLSMTGDEPHLFALTSALILPCLTILFLMRNRLRIPEVQTDPQQDFAVYRAKLLHSVAHSGLLLPFLSLVCFGLCTNVCNYFIKGLCAVNGSDPTDFFFYCTVTIMAVRLLFSNRLDGLPRYCIVPVVAALMASGLCLLIHGPSWLFIPGTIVYGMALALLYPLQAAVIYDRSTPDTRSVNSNLMISMFDLAALLAPLSGGLVLSSGLGYHAVITVGATSVLMSGVFFSLDGLRQRARSGGKTTGHS